MMDESSRPLMTKKPGPKMSARNTLMDILSRKEHSEQEVRAKLQNKFEQSEIDTAIEYAKAKGWLPSNQDQVQAMSEKIAADLKRRGKGPEYINQYLLNRGLSEVKINAAEELEKALELVENKFSLSKKQPVDPDKVGRFLMSRGFSEDIVRKVIYDSTFKF